MSQAGTTIERAAEHAAERRRKALEAYRALLLRNDTPKSGDEKLLIEVMATLGRQSADLASDLELALRIPQCAAIAAKLPDLESTARQAKATWAAGNAEVGAARTAFEETARAKLGALERELARARGPWNDAILAAGDLPQLEAKWVALAAVPE